MSKKETGNEKKAKAGYAPGTMVLMGVAPGFIEKACKRAGMTMTGLAGSTGIGEDRLRRVDIRKEEPSPAELVDIALGLGDSVRGVLGFDLHSHVRGAGTTLPVRIRGQKDTSILDDDRQDVLFSYAAIRFSNGIEAVLPCSVANLLEISGAVATGVPCVASFGDGWFSYINPEFIDDIQISVLDKDGCPPAGFSGPVPPAVISAVYMMAGDFGWAKMPEASEGLSEDIINRNLSEVSYADVCGYLSEPGWESVKNALVLAGYVSIADFYSGQLEVRTLYGNGNDAVWETGPYVNEQRSTALSGILYEAHDDRPDPVFIPGIGIDSGYSDAVQFDLSRVAMLSFSDEAGERASLFRAIDDDGEYDEDGPAADDIPIEELHVGMRAYNCLKRAGINTMGSLAEWIYKDDGASLAKIRELGPKTLKEILTEFFLWKQEFSGLDPGDIRMIAERKLGIKVDDICSENSEAISEETPRGTDEGEDEA